MTHNKNSLIAANEAFYSAFATSDTERMERIWASNEDISCIHPGWPPLDGQDEVMDSWRCILSAKSPLTGISDAKAYQHGNVGYVICHEHLEPGVLVATNIFCLEGEDWKLMHHQAGISPSDTSPANNAGSQTLQ